MSDQEDNGIALIASKKGALRLRSDDLVRRGLDNIGQRSTHDTPERDKDDSLRFEETAIVRMLKEFGRYLDEVEEERSRANRRLKEFEAYLRDGRAGICTVLETTEEEKRQVISARENACSVPFI